MAPNPAQQQTTLYLRSEQSEEVSIAIIDVHGKVLQQPSDLQLLAGQEIQHVLDLEKLGIPSGLYLVQLRGETFQSTQKLIIQ